MKFQSNYEQITSLTINHVPKPQNSVFTTKPCAKNRIKMTFMWNLFVTIAISFITKFAASQSVTGLTNQSLSSLLNIPPYYSFLGYEKPTQLSSVNDQQLKQIADLYDLKISDLYQLYDLANTNLPSTSPDTYISMIEQIAKVSQLERIRRGISLPEYFPQYSIPNASPKMNYPSYVLQRRDLTDIAQDMYQGASSKMSSLYNNVYNMVDRTLPPITQSLKNQIDDIVNEYSPSQDLQYAENFASQLKENLRSMLS